MARRIVGRTSVVWNVADVLLWNAMPGDQNTIGTRCDSSVAPP